MKSLKIAWISFVLAMFSHGKSTPVATQAPSNSTIALSSKSSDSGGNVTSYTLLLSQHTPNHLPKDEKPLKDASSRIVISSFPNVPRENRQENNLNYEKPVQDSSVSRSTLPSFHVPRENRQESYQGIGDNRTGEEARRNDNMKQNKHKMPRFKTILVTGGAGYIGSHCVVDLLEAGYDVIAIDNFANAVGDEDGSPALRRAEQITGKKITFYKADLLDKPQINDIFDKHNIDCVIHFAALKAVGESMQQPLLYYQNNLLGMLNLLEIMRSHNCYQMVFSSSCTVYGEPEHLPITESHPTGNITNVYGRTKYFIEEMLKDLSAAEKKWNIISLRYFNPVGAHPSGLIGEDPTKEFTNLMPFMAQVALGKKPLLTVFGSDYNTPDGTGIRDYIHVMDLANGHLAALDLISKNHVGLKVYNLGTGKGVSVKQLVDVFERVTSTKIPLKYVDRRLGDITAMWADPSLAREELGWSTKRSIEEMCTDFWRWQTMNPDGYPKKNKTSVFVNGNGS